MSIMWKYLDKRSAAIAAIKDFASMRFIINSTDDEIKRAYEKMTGTASAKLQLKLFSDKERGDYHIKAIGDEFVKQMTVNEALAMLKLDSEGMVEVILKDLNNEKTT